MKKVISACLVIVTLLAYLMTVNFYQSKDYDEVAKMGQTANSYQIYLQDSRVTPNDELVFFKKLAHKYGISIILTTRGRDNTVEKSVISNRLTFPTSSFRLNHVKLRNSEDYYSSRNMNDHNQKGVIPIFAKNNHVILQRMERYFKSKKIVDGVYTIVPGEVKKDVILKQIAAFYGISRAKLLTPTTGRAVEYFTKDILIFGFVLFLTILIFVLVNSYYPVAKSGSIGVKKINGWGNWDIFVKLITFGVLTIVVSAVIIDVVTLLVFSYLPHNFLFTCIAIQVVILLLYLLVNIFTYLAIRQISIADLLKGRFHFDSGLRLAFLLKILMTIISAILLFNASGAINDTLESYRLQQDWENASSLLTLNSEGEFFLSNEAQASKIMNNWFIKMSKSKNVYYVDSNFYTTKEILPENISVKYPIQKFSFMTVNGNFVNAKLPEVKKYLNQKQSVFLVPAKYQNDAKKIRLLLQNFRFNELTNRQQRKIKPERLKVIIKYYSENINPITYNVRLKKRFNNPILEIIQAKKMTDSQILALGNTDKASPIKIANTKENKTMIRKLAENSKAKLLELKFVTLNEILATSLNASYRGLRTIIFVLLAVFVINLFTTTFLILYVVSSRQKELSVKRLLGYRKFDRYKPEIITLLFLGGGQIIALVCVRASIIPILIGLLLLIIDLGIFNIVVHFVEIRDLPFLLKGGLS